MVGYNDGGLMTSSMNGASLVSIPNGASIFRATTNGSMASKEVFEISKSKQLRDNNSKTILDLLDRAVRNAPGNYSMFLEDGIQSAPKIQSYSELYETAKLQQTGLFLSGDVILIYFETPRLNVEWFWSVMAFGGIPAICNPLSNNQATLKSHLSHLNSLLKTPRVIAAQRLVERFNSVPELQVTSAEYISSISPPVNAVWLSKDDVRINEPAVLLFTSGSSGNAKAVEFTHHQLFMAIEGKSNFHGTNMETNYLTWVGLDHSANLIEIHLQAMLNGSCQLHVLAADMVNEPAGFLDLLSRYKIGYTFSPNFFLRAVVQAFEGLESIPDWDLSSLRVIMCAGEANLTSVIHDADKIVTRFGAPEHSLKAAYGLSETCAAAFYSNLAPSYDVEKGYKFGSAGTRVSRDVEVRIVDESENPLHAGEAGRILLRGAIVFKQYYNNSEATNACMTKDGWFDTGDLGSIDVNGALIILGRTKETIAINGLKYASFELETAIDLELPDTVTASFTACFSTVVKDYNHEGIVVLFHPSKDVIFKPRTLQEVISTIKKVIVEVCSQAPHAVIPLPKKLLPKSTLGKLSRAKLKEQYEGGAFSEYDARGVQAVQQAELGSVEPLSSFTQIAIADTIAELTNVPRSSIHRSSEIFGFGLDSLKYIRLKRKLEKTLALQQPIPMPVLLQSRTVSELEQGLHNLGVKPYVYESIIPLVKTGSRIPLILAHPGGGEILIWLNLLKYLPDRPIYALRIRGLQEGEECFRSMDEIIDCYIEGIKRIQPNGPYALLGLSFGGSVVFELTKRLNSIGEAVLFTGGIDNPVDPAGLMPTNENRTRGFFMQMLHFHSILTYEAALEYEAALKHLPDDEFYAAVTSRFTAERLESLSLNMTNVKAWEAVTQSVYELIKCHKTTGTVDRLDIFCVPPLSLFGYSDQRWFDEALGGWQAHCTEKVRFHHVQGHHYSILDPGNIECFQEALCRAMEARGV